jgi:hypothetical protein
MSPFQFSAGPLNNPVLTRADVSDVPASFVADPFMLRVGYKWFMFFEVLNAAAGKGEIGLAVSSNGTHWVYQQIVLSEPFHLSYPYVFLWDDEYYMVPETHKARSVRLYRATHFPHRWSYVATLLDKAYFADSSVFRHNGKWWLFTETNPNGNNDTLRLFYADILTGPWHEHPESPVVKGNPRIARPGGRVLSIGDKVIRYAQDCFPRYGMQVRAFEISDLTTKSYKEKEVPSNPILTGSNADTWNEHGMHHIDPHQVGDDKWIACVDGHKKVLVSESTPACPPQ